MRAPEDVVIATTENPFAAPTADTEALIKALQELYRAYQKVSIYPPGHPAIPEALRHTVACFDEALLSGTIFLGVSSDHLLVGDLQLAETTGALRSLAALLHDVDVAAIEFYVGLTHEQLQAFVVTLALARRDGAKGPALIAALKELNLDGLRVVPIDYGLLNFSDGARETSAEGGPDVWDSLVSRVLEPDRSRDCSPMALARQVTEEIERQEGTGFSTLRRRIYRIARRIATAAPFKRAAMRKRLAQFVSALSPDLRGDLLRVDPRRAEDSVTLISELAETLPEPDLIDALQEIDRVGARVPRQVINLMNQLMRVSNQRHTLSQGLEDTMARWGIDMKSFQAGSPDLREALEEVFQSRSDVSCNPDSYQVLMDELSLTELEDTDVTLESRYRDPRDAQDVRVHAAEVGVQVLGKAGGEKFRAGLLGYVDTFSNDLLSMRRFVALRDAAVCARTYSALDSQSSEVQLAAECYLKEFEDDDRITKILKYSCSDNKMSEAAITLLGLGGVNAVDQALTYLDVQRRFDVAEMLRRFIVESGAEAVLEIVERRAIGGWTQLRPAFPILRRFSIEEVGDALEGLMGHEDYRVRRESLVSLCELDGQPGAVEPRLRRALGDRDSRLTLFAVDRLARLKTDLALEILGDFIRGQLRHAMPSHNVAARVCRSLASAGASGISELCRSLDALRFSIRPIRVKTAVTVWRVLRCHGGSPEVNAALERWKWSPARFFGISLSQLTGLRSH